MKLVFDFVPLLVFFAAFKRYDIYVATAAAMAATAGQVAWLKLRGRAVPPALWLSFGVIAVFGGATLLLQDEWFMKLKPTILYWTLASALLFGQAALGRDFLKAMIGGHLTMPASAWRLMNRMWIGFFAFMGAANLYVAHSFPTAAWVSFKVFWCTGLLFAFTIVQGLALAKHLGPHEEKQP